MNFRHLALKNVKGNWRSYKAFLYSSCFSIIIFFMYASFIYHPDVVNGEIKTQLQNTLKGCNYIILGFSALFILYSNSTFLRSRKKELGLLTLLGSTKTQIARMVVLEQLLMGVLSIAAGIGVGMLFSKLFFMMMSTLLDVKNPIPFVWNGKPIVITAVTYFLLFLILSVFGLWNIRKLEIIELLKDARKQRVEPFYSKWLFVLGSIFIVAGYALATRVTLVNFMTFFFIVIGLVIAGSYFFFTQGSVAILKMLQKRKHIFYKQPNLFVISSLVYKMKDNARFLFTITILTAIVVSATGTMYTYFSDLREKILESSPHAVAYTEKGTIPGEIITKEEMQRLLQTHGFADAKEVELAEFPASFMANTKREMDVTIVSEEDYNKEAKKQGKRLIHNKVGSGTLIYPDAYGDFRFYNKNVFDFKVQGKDYSMKLNEQYTESVFNSSPKRTHLLFLVNKEDYEKLIASVPDTEKYVYHGFIIKDWEKTEKLVNDLRKHVGDEKQLLISERVLTYNMIKQGGALTLFIGAFISILFFLAACSMTYFKWFNDIERDRLQYQSLMRTGMTKKEVKSIAVRQMGTIFFVPIIVGIIHSSFALYALSSMLKANLLQTSVIVISIYCAAAFIYFLFAQREYMKHI
ncbi:FtsX-like permease family protein [Ectobacillus panaciterrae]|uniref:FtsX-like permease family protein n=1 Tax=Ectobacillus panaciterrae TaxID=363872 RepID=UPI0004190F50|nr:ABC transporter permease [Ectobacillus panaciterrae]